MSTGGEALIEIRKHLDRIRMPRPQESREVLGLFLENQAVIAVVTTKAAPNSLVNQRVEPVSMVSGLKR
jgi:hypothetical protein